MLQSIGNALGGLASSIGEAVGGPSATLVISCDTTSCMGGAPFSGKVYLNVAKEVDASHLQLALVGEEYTSVEAGSNQDRRRYSERNRFLLRRWDMAEFANNKAQIGQFEYSFNFTLPATDDLPSSSRTLAYYSQYNPSYCDVWYFLEARLHKTGWCSWDTTASQVLQVTIPKLPAKPVEDMVHETMPVRCCCCINRGEMDLKVTVNKDAFQPGEKLDILYEARNPTTVEVQYVKVKLVETIIWKAQGHEEYNWITAMQHIPSAKLNKGERHISLEEDPVSLVVPATSRSSYKGRLITISHHVEVTLHTGSFTTSPMMHIPIQIYNPSLCLDPNVGATGAAQLPAGWQGIAAPAVNLDNVNLCEQQGGAGNPVVAVPVATAAVEVGAPPTGGSKFCTSCGKPAEGMKFCVSCGNKC